MSSLFLRVIFGCIITNCVRFADSQDMQGDLFISNLDKNCLRCLCFAATNCDRSLGCKQGYCGPYKISRLFWIDANKVTLPEDDHERAGAYEDCSLQFGCAQKIIKNYIAKYARDCNGDGVTDCEDYSMINFNGGYQCQPPLERNEAGKNWTNRFQVCKPVTE